MPNDIVRWGETGDQVEPVNAKKDGGSNANKPEAAEYINWLWSRFGAGVSLDRKENLLLHMPLKNSLAIEQGVGSATFARSTIATYINRYGMLQTAAIDEPRFEAEDYLAEEVGTNELTRSEELDHGDWSNISSTVSADAITAPDGTATADKIIPDNLATSGRVVQSLTPAVGPVAFSFFAKAAELTNVRIEIFSDEDGSIRAIIDLTDGSVFSTSGSPTIKVIQLANGWFRIILVKVMTGVTSFQVQIRQDSGDSANGSDGFYAWGAHLNEFSFASSYIQTVAAPVTRTADSLEVTIENNITLQANPGTIIIDFDLIGNTGSNQRILHITGETTREIRSFSNSLRGAYGSSSLIGATVIVPFIAHRAALQYDGTDAKFWLDGEEKGVAASPDTTDALGSVISVGHTAGSGVINGHIANLRIYDRALTDFEMAVA